MNFDFSDDQKALRDHAQRFLAGSCPASHLRHCLDTGTSPDTELWRQMVDLGWPALSVPEEHGGVGLGALELCVHAEEVGRVLAPVPFVTNALAVELLKRCDRKIAGDVLDAVAVGEQFVTLALADAGTSWANPGVSARITDGKISGEKSPVAFLSTAQQAIVAGQDSDGTLQLVLVDLSSAGVTRKNYAGPGLDPLIPFGRLLLDGTTCTLLAEGKEAASLLATAQNNAAVLTAFEQIGGAEAALKLAKDYSLERYTFGRAIGSYQAIKHKLADMAVKIELARANAYFGAWAMAHEAPELPIAAAASRVSAIEAYNFAAEECLQVFGGIGYTWEADCHFFYKRARLLAISMGNIGEWCERLIDNVELAAH